MSQDMNLFPGYKGPYNPNPGSGEALIVIYNYVPSLVLGIVAAVTFTIGLSSHVFHFARGKGTRKIEFLWCFGCAMEIVGYGFRIGSHFSPYTIIDFVLQYFMIVCAPIFFTAAIYLSLSIACDRIPGAASVVPLKPRTIVILFVCIDIVTTATQVIGSALIGVSESNRSKGKTPPVSTKTANDILLAGLAIQNAGFLCFLVLLGFTFWNMHRTKKGDHVSFSRPFLIVLTTTCLLIFLRTLFRLAETAEGVFGPASSNETLFACLEYVPIILAVFAWGVSPVRSTVPISQLNGMSDKDHETSIQIS